MHVTGQWNDEGDRHKMVFCTLLPRIRVHAPVHVAANFWEPDHVLRVQVHAPNNSGTCACTTIWSMSEIIYGCQKWKISRNCAWFHPDRHCWGILHGFCRFWCHYGRKCSSIGILYRKKCFKILQLEVTPGCQRWKIDRNCVFLFT